MATPESSRPPSWDAVESVGDSEEEEEEKRMLHCQPARNRRKLRHHLLPELVRRKAKEQEWHSFCLHAQTCRSSIYQLRQIEHEIKMQEQAMTFQAKMEQDRQTFDAEMSTRLQQQSAQFQMTIM